MTKTKIEFQHQALEISTRALALLADLAELEDAGLIAREDTLLAYSGYDEGSIEIAAPATVTPLGRKVLEHISSPN